MTNKQIRLLSNKDKKFIGFDLHDNKFISGLTKDLKNKFEVVKGHSAITDETDTLLLGLYIFQEIHHVDKYTFSHTLASKINPYYDKIVEEKPKKVLIDEDYPLTNNLILVSCIRVMGSPQSGISFLLMSSAIELENTPDAKAKDKIRKLVTDFLKVKYANMFPNSQIHIRTSYVSAFTPSKQKLLGMNIHTDTSDTYLTTNKNIEGLF